jgi:MFS family permease
MFFASNWFYTYHFNAVNGAKFSTRTKALNNTLYYIMQIVGAFIFGYALDRENIRRTIRARIAWVALFVLTFAIWGGGYAFQKGYNREETEQENYPGLIDFKRNPGAYIGPMFLYMFYGFYDAAFQTCVYWYMGALSNNSRKLAHFAGFYKGIQSAGAAIMWSLDGIYKMPYMRMFATVWGVLAASLLIGLPVILWKIRDTVPLEEDLAFTDETFADVAPTVEIERRASVSKAESPVVNRMEKS